MNIQMCVALHLKVCWCHGSYESMRFLKKNLQNSRSQAIHSDYHYGIRLISKVPFCVMHYLPITPFVSPGVDWSSSRWKSAYVTNFYVFSSQLQDCLWGDQNFSCCETKVLPGLLRLSS